MPQGERCRQVNLEVVAVVVVSQPADTYVVAAVGGLLGGRADAAIGQRCCVRGIKTSPELLFLVEVGDEVQTNSVLEDCLVETDGFEGIAEGVGYTEDHFPN